MIALNSVEIGYVNGDSDIFVMAYVGRQNLPTTPTLLGERLPSNDSPTATGSNNVING